MNALDVYTRKYNSSQIKKGQNFKCFGAGLNKKGMTFFSNNVKSGGHSSSSKVNFNVL